MKRLWIAALLVVMTLALCSCNYKVFDMTYHFEQAQIRLPDGSVVEGKVMDWTDDAVGDQLQVTIDGVTYLTHAENVVLMTGK